MQDIIQLGQALLYACWETDNVQLLRSGETLQFLCFTSNNAASQQYGEGIFRSAPHAKACFITFRAYLRDLYFAFTKAEQLGLWSALEVRWKIFPANGCILGEHHTVNWMWKQSWDMLDVRYAVTHHQQKWRDQVVEPFRALYMFSLWQSDVWIAKDGTLQDLLQ